MLDRHARSSRHAAGVPRDVDRSPAGCSPHAAGAAEELGALHRARLEFFLTQAIDTTVRGFVYDASGRSRRRSPASAGRADRARALPRATRSRWRCLAAVACTSRMAAGGARGDRARCSPAHDRGRRESETLSCADDPRSRWISQGSLSIWSVRRSVLGAIRAAILVFRPGTGPSTHRRCRHRDRTSRPCGDARPPQYFNAGLQAQLGRRAERVRPLRGHARSSAAERAPGARQPRTWAQASPTRRARLPTTRSSPTATSTSQTPLPDETPARRSCARAPSRARLRHRPTRVLILVYPMTTGPTSTKPASEGAPAHRSHRSLACERSPVSHHGRLVNIAQAKEAFRTDEPRRYLRIVPQPAGAAAAPAQAGHAAAELGPAGARARAPALAARSSARAGSR